MRVEHEHYTRDECTTGPDGAEVSRSTGEVVDAQHVRQFLDARSFFEAGGWVETQTKRQGRIVVETREPDGTTHLRVFTPVTVQP